MNGDEMSRGMYQQNRRPSSQNKSYNSPSANYSYNYNSSGNGNSGYNNGGHQQSYKKPGGGGQHTNNKFKSHHGGGGGSSDKLLIKQNDQIIKLLKEIRDRLPAPPAGSPVSQPAPEQDLDDVDVERSNFVEYAERGNERDTSEDEPDFMSLDEQEADSEES
ncbi:MAG: hypothetical protein ACM31E_02145 [Fibrobacterota bacterium]|nr:hypothetical protein [Chitinispirillaceae bacterium]